MLNLADWRGALIRKRITWCLRWCLLLTVSLGSVALSAWLMLGSLVEDLPSQSGELMSLRISNDRLAADITHIQRQLKESENSIDANRSFRNQLQRRLDRINLLADVGPARMLSMVDRETKTSVHLQLGHLAQLNRLNGRVNLHIRSVESSAHWVVTEVEFVDG